jgi:hypothetical protein
MANRSRKKKKGRGKIRAPHRSMRIFSSLRDRRKDFAICEGQRVFLVRRLDALIRDPFDFRGSSFQAP